MSKNLNTIIIDLLKKHKGEYLTAPEIACLIKDTENDFFKDMMSRNNRTEQKNISQIIAETSTRYLTGQLKNISRTADKPLRYFYNIETGDELETKIIAKNNHNKPEHELYPILIQYCKDELGIQAMRMNEGKTNNDTKGKNIWLHADIVGFKDLTEKYSQETKDCMHEYSADRASLYSFEVKDGIITAGNLREAFFQTVSNSSWANYSYLVAEKLHDNADEELQLLCKSFNIGFILLDKNDITQSKIYIRAPKTNIDWNMVNRISANSDFKKYLQRVIQSLQSHSNNYIPTATWE